MSDVITLVANGKEYSGWTEIECGRGLDRCASSFDIALTEKWLNGATAKPIQLLPYTAVQVYLGKDLVLTGISDGYCPGFSGSSHAVKISGRSKTAQLVDCTPDIASGQFSGYSLAAIAQSICGIFSIEAVIQTALALGQAGTLGQANQSLVDPQNAPAGPLTDATLERGESAFTFLDRLATVAGVLLTDDEQGRLVLTTAGSARASGGLVQGRNIEAASAMLNGAVRFSQYIVKGQCGVGGAIGASGWSDTGDDDQVTPSVGEVQTEQRAVATDSGVPVYRPKVIIAESQLNQTQLQLRANWEKQYALGKASRASVTVKGWRQPNGTLWKINQIVSCNIPFLAVQQDLLILSIAYKQSLNGGKTTVLEVGPVAGATPNPNLLKRSKRGKKGGGGAIWDGVSA
jgi:prophage tail gpP-like protein